MNTIIEWLNTPAFTLFNAPTTWAEVLGFITGALCVYLVAKANIFNWPIGIANNVLWIVLFMSAGLYADSGLQIVYIILAIWGWITWATRDENSYVRPITRTAPKQWVALAAAGILATIVMYLFLEHLTNSTVPLWDSITTVISLLATWGQIYKKIESWVLWILVDIIYVPLYIYKGLTLTAILYVGFGLLCVYGLIEWRRILHAQRNSIPVNPVDSTVSTITLTPAEDLS